VTAKLTPKQAAFVQEYLIDLNATQAAIRAGYSPKTANEQGARLLANVSVRGQVDLAMAERSKRTQVDADWLLTRLAGEAEADLADLYYEGTGRLKPIHEWPKSWRQGLVAGMKIRQEIGEGEDPAIADIIEVKLADRNPKLRMIGDHIGVQAFKANVGISADATLESLIAELTGGSGQQ